ncbi:MAG: Fic family protein [Candidatus Saccharimonadales bacterium]
MGLSNRQQQLMAALLTGSSTLPHLRQLSVFGGVTERTLQRDLNELIEAGLVGRWGEARAVAYSVTSAGRLNLSLATQQLEQLFAGEERPDLHYDFNRLDVLGSTSLFTNEEQKRLNNYNAVFQEKLQTAPKDIVRRERQRITIELSWKSSQFEGNTYSLLETETLLKEGIPARGKTQEETIMVLNHKKALDFSEQHREVFVHDLRPQSIVELHKLLGEGLFDYGLRERLVGITGSVYKPLANKFQIEDELKRLCGVINAKQNVYEKAVLAFTYICYLQPFNDGNKRTGRILANAILYAHDSFPLSLRAVDVNTYKLAILAFYELSILGNAKQVFIDQAKFSAENYAI